MSYWSVTLREFNCFEECIRENEIIFKTVSPFFRWSRVLFMRERGFLWVCHCLSSKECKYYYIAYILLLIFPLFLTNFMTGTLMSINILPIKNKHKRDRLHVFDTCRETVSLFCCELRKGETLLEMHTKIFI